MLTFKTVEVGSMQTNCYFVINSKNECLIIDPGAQGEDLTDFIKNSGLQPRAALITHGHFDHIGGLTPLREAFHLPVYIGASDQVAMSDPLYNVSAYLQPYKQVREKPAEHTWKEEGKQTVCGFSFDLIHLPGHTPGHVLYYWPDEGLLFGGDVLFRGSIGRSDFPRGDGKLLVEEIHEKVLNLPPETRVLPGHGPFTTIQEEAASNPFLQ